MPGSGLRVVSSLLLLAASAGGRFETPVITVEDQPEPPSSQLALKHRTAPPTDRLVLELKQRALNIRGRNVAIMTSYAEEYKNLTENLLCSLDRLGLLGATVVAVSVNAACASLATRFQPQCIQSQHVLSRPTHFDLALRNGVDVVFLDGDVVVLRDFLDEVVGFGADFAVSSDTPKYKYSTSFFVSSGVFYARASPGGIAVVEAWLHSMETRRGTYGFELSQNPLNHLTSVAVEGGMPSEMDESGTESWTGMTAIAGGQKPVPTRWRVLNPLEFQNGMNGVNIKQVNGTYVDESHRFGDPSVATIHTNWIPSVWGKMRAFRAMGWDVCNSPDYKDEHSTPSGDANVYYTTKLDRGYYYTAKAGPTVSATHNAATLLGQWIEGIKQSLTANLKIEF